MQISSISGWWIIVIILTKIFSELFEIKNGYLNYQKHLFVDFFKGEYFFENVTAIRTKLIITKSQKDMIFEAFVDFEPFLWILILQSVHQTSLQNFNVHFLQIFKVVFQNVFFQAFCDSHWVPVQRSPGQLVFISLTPFYNISLFLLRLGVYF